MGLAGKGSAGVLPEVGATGEDGAINIALFLLCFIFACSCTLQGPAGLSLRTHVSSTSAPGHACTVS